ncbi:helix-turn-helix transcriptional regulator [Mesorhizobium sp. WSM3224]|uniref:helix-turn-helix domain-containing protein n=1 Tax=Mesorhizobium sp. WSM3224 TaxID=1040986 RepID=UPI0004878B10|nr:helix-turn-helix transcriptional regulator [Mesorhizobium sp. WSM3224]
MPIRKRVFLLDTFPERLRAKMIVNRLSQSDIARLVGYTPTGVWNWLQGNTFPRPETLSALAEKLDVTEDWLRDGDATPDSDSSPDENEQPESIAERMESLRVEIAALIGFDLSRVKLSLEFGPG